MKKKSNKQFMIFSAIMMVLVVDAHAWSSMSLLTRYMTYNMYIMPAFVFVSGYFFSIKQELSFVEYAKKKIKSLILPYYIWWGGYAIILLLLKYIFSITIAEVTLDTLILGPWKGGGQQVFTSPGWFVCCLFLIQLIYYFFRKITKKFWNEWIALAVLTGITVYTTYYVTNNEINHDFCNVYRVLIMTWFYHFGIIYRTYIEDWFKRTSGAVVCTVCIVFITFLNQVAYNIGAFAYNVDFRFNTLSWSLDGMQNFGIWCGLYLIVIGLVGIAFWLKISQVLVPALENSFFCNFISNHTFEIMLNHMIFMWFVNLVLVKVNSLKALINFDITSAIYSPGYIWQDSKWSNFVYLLFGMIGAILVAWMADQAKKKLIMKK